MLFGRLLLPTSKILARRLLAAALLANTLAPFVSAEDWSRFRGPNGSGVVASEKGVPVEWSPTKNLSWKVELPGSGVSSPIVVGDRVFVTCYSGYGLDRNSVGKIEDLRRHLLCFQAESGEKLWEKTIEPVLPEDPYAGIGVTAHGYASHTPASDGKRVYAFFGKSGVYAFDLDGNQLWQKSVGTGSDAREWGSSSSVVVWDEKVYVTASAESRSMVAINGSTGEIIWQEQADGMEGLWGTPTIVPVSDDRTDLVVSAPYEIWAFDPETGKLRWYCESSQADQTHSSAVTEDGVVYAFTGRGGASIAVRAGGTDDVSNSHVVWKGKDTARFGTPVVHDGKVYLVASGIVTCLDAKTGEEIAKQRIRPASGAEVAAENRGGPGGRGPGERGPSGEGPRGGGPGGEGPRGDGPGGRSGRGGGGFGSLDYASPIIVGDHLYYLNGTGDMFVFEVDGLKQVAVNRVTDESESFGGTPAVSNGRMFLRSSGHLYCVSAQ